MEKDSGTRSGLLWEIQRILNDCHELPQILLMENVPEVIGDKNRDAFGDWISYLDNLGYKSKWKVMNATEFGVPQNRKRCFMVSCLGDYFYDFPMEIGCSLRLKDLLEKDVKDDYYLSERAILGAIKTTYDSSRLENRIEKDGIMPTICARDYKDPKLVVEGCECLGMLEGGKWDKCIDSARRVYSVDQASPTLTTCGGGNQEVKVAIEKDANVDSEKKYSVVKLPHGYFKGGIYDTDVCSTIDTGVGNWHTLIGKDEIKVYDAYNKREIDNKTVGTLCTNAGYRQAGVFWVKQPNMRVRKLTERECFRLMGVKDDDFERVEKNQSKSSLYHCAGDSIVTACLMAIFGEMLDIDWENKIKLLFEGV